MCAPRMFGGALFSVFSVKIASLKYFFTFAAETENYLISERRKDCFNEHHRKDFSFGALTTSRR